VIWEGRDALVRQMTARHDPPVEELADQLEMGLAPEDWRDVFAQIAATTNDDMEPAKRNRFLMGQAMYRWRGRVPAQTIANTLTDITGEN
jgi:hypothetical protein